MYCFIDFWIKSFAAEVEEREEDRERESLSCDVQSMMNMNPWLGGQMCRIPGLADISLSPWLFSLPEPDCMYLLHSASRHRIYQPLASYRGFAIVRRLSPRDVSFAKDVGKILPSWRPWMGAPAACPWKIKYRTHTRTAQNSDEPLFFFVVYRASTTIPTTCGTSTAAWASAPGPRTASAPPPPPPPRPTTRSPTSPPARSRTTTATSCRRYAPPLGQICFSLSNARSCVGSRHVYAAKGDDADYHLESKLFLKHLKYFWYVLYLDGWIYRQTNGWIYR